MQKDSKLKPQFSPIDMTLITCYHTGLSGTWSDSNEWVLCIPQTSCIT